MSDSDRRGWIELAIANGVQRWEATDARFALLEEAPPIIEAMGERWAVSIQGPEELTWDGGHDTDDFEAMIGMKLEMRDEEEALDEPHITLEEGNDKPIIGGHLLVVELEESDGNTVRVAGVVEMILAGESAPVVGRLDVTCPVDM